MEVANFRSQAKNLGEVCNFAVQAENAAKFATSPRNTKQPKGDKFPRTFVAQTRVYHVQDEYLWRIAARQCWNESDPERVGTGIA
jgi:hypothetical protein